MRITLHAVLSSLSYHKITDLLYDTDCLRSLVINSITVGQEHFLKYFYFSTDICINDIVRNSRNHGKLERLSPCGVKHWWLLRVLWGSTGKGRRSSDQALCRGQLGTASAATQPFPGMSLLLGLSHLLGFPPNLSELQPITHSDCTGWHFWKHSGAGRGKNIRPARSEQCLPSWQHLPWLEEEMCPLMMLFLRAGALPGFFQEWKEYFGQMLQTVDSILVNCPLAGCILFRELGIQAVTPGEWGNGEMGNFLPKPTTCWGSDCGVWNRKSRAVGNHSQGKAALCTGSICL